MLRQISGSLTSTPKLRATNSPWTLSKGPPLEPGLQKLDKNDPLLSMLAAKDDALPHALNTSGITVMPDILLHLNIRVKWDGFIGLKIAKRKARIIIAKLTKASDDKGFLGSSVNGLDDLLAGYDLATVATK